MRSPLGHGLDLSSTHLQLFCGLPVTLAGPMTRPSAVGHQRTLALGGRSSPAAPPPSTLDLTWTIQVRTLYGASNWTIPKMRNLLTQYMQVTFFFLSLSNTSYFIQQADQEISSTL